ncbi:MAG: hypothetical protein Q4D45_10500 [Lachnospiraceae bacterium]|nr:hypothetical protein [Lachnospiraceae bacterium]
MEDYITRAEHEEFCKRLEEEDHRQNRRIEELEKTSAEIHTMSKSLVVMCEKMTTMNENLDTLKDKVEVLEKEPADTWNKVKGAVITAFASGLVGIIIGNLI